MVIYKYLDEKGAIATVSKSAVLLKTPEEFNDPFDSTFFMDKVEYKKAFDLFINYQIFKNIYDEIIKKNKKPVRMKFLAGIIKQDILLTASLVRKKKKYEMQQYLVAYYKFASKYLNKNDTELKKQFKKTINDVLKKIRSITLVSCFGSSHDSVLMWSHYADKHRGACIEYEINDEAFQKVSYSNNLPVFRLSDIMEIIFGHNFISKEVDTSKKEYQFMLW